MYNEDDTAIISEVVYADFICNNCDTPGARKISGTAGHSANINPCPWCHCRLVDVNRPEGYNVDGKPVTNILNTLVTLSYLKGSISETTSTC
jgi:hypothetical protein